MNAAVLTHTHGYGAIPWNMGTPSGATLLKRNNSPSPRTHELLVASQLEVGIHEPFCPPSLKISFVGSGYNLMIVWQVSVCETIGSMANSTTDRQKDRKTDTHTAFIIKI